MEGITRMMAGLLGLQQEKTPIDRWLTRSTLHESQSCNVRNQRQSPLFSKLPQEIREKIYTFAGQVTTRFSNIEYDPFYRFTFTSYTEPTAGYLELDSEYESMDSQTLRSVTVPSNAVALFGLCRRIRREALECLYRETVLAVQPRALSKPSYIVPGRLALMNITKMHQHLQLPSSGEEDIYGQKNASVRALPGLLTAVESWDLLPKLNSVTLDIQSRYLWGFSRASPRDKRLPAETSPEALPFCQHDTLPVVEGFEPRSLAKLPVPVRLPCRYNRSFFDLNQLYQPCTVEISLHPTAQNSVDRSMLYLGESHACDLQTSSTMTISKALESNNLPEKHQCANVVCNIVEGVKDIAEQLLKWDKDYNELDPVEEAYRQYRDPAWKEHCKTIDLRSWRCKLDVHRPDPSGSTELNRSMTVKTLCVESAQDSLFAVGLRARPPKDEQPVFQGNFDRDEENLVAW